MIMLQIGDKDRQYVIDTRVMILPHSKKYSSREYHQKYLHNAKFDYKFIKKWAGISLEKIYDTFLVERVLHCGKQEYGYSLSKCCERYLGVTRKETFGTNSSDSKVNLTRSIKLRMGQTMWFISWTFGRKWRNYVRIHWKTLPASRMKVVKVFRD